jgi:hypothetical protein
MATTSDLPQAILACVPPRVRRITARQMAEILSHMQATGLDLANDCAGDRSPEEWAKSCRGIQCISIMGAGDPAGRWHGSIRYDDPGSMAPYFHAAVMFAPPGASGPDSDWAYLRRHCDRLLIVAEPWPTEPAPKPETVIAECGNGHHWEIDAHDEPARCPMCGEYWV